jgi:hypothetical protein
MIALPRGAIVPERNRAINRRRTITAGGPDRTMRVLVRVFARGDARKARVLLELIDPRRDDRSVASVRAAAARAGLSKSAASRAFRAFTVALVQACVAEGIDPARLVRIDGAGGKGPTRPSGRRRAA